MTVRPRPPRWSVPEPHRREDLPARQRPARTAPFAPVHSKTTSPRRRPLPRRSSRSPASATTARAGGRQRRRGARRLPQFKARPASLEQMLHLDYEVSVVLARDENGTVKCFPTVENSHRKGIPDVSIAPARGSGLPARQRPNTPSASPKSSASSAPWRRVLRQPRPALREQMAPRPHNSGHHTVDACVTSQYEQQVRALCGLPLAMRGRTRRR